MSAHKVSHIDVRPEWLKLHSEAAIEPDLPIIDAHHHIYYRPDKLYLLPELQSDFGSGHNIAASVYIECRTALRDDEDPLRRSLGETEYIADIAESMRGPSKICAAIVGHVDLMQAGARAAELLEAHVETGKGRFRGVRNTSAWHPDPPARGSTAGPPPNPLPNAPFREGFRCLSRAGLSFDAWMYHTQLDELVDLAKAFPDTPIVLNHLGGPIHIGPYADKRKEVFVDWRARLVRVAECENVSIKLGGMGMRMFGFDFYTRPVPPGSELVAEAWRPYIEAAIETFGPRRAMFESNFPVDKAMLSYGVLWNAFKRIAQHYSPDERAELFGGAARRFYRIEG
jgi:L-fuconolactonase